jgi:hypothetical protein
LLIEEEGSAHRFYPKSHISLGEAIDFPRSVCERFVDKLPDRLSLINIPSRWGDLLHLTSEVLIFNSENHPALSEQT